MFKGGADLKEIVDGFNKIGASSKDLIEMLKAVKAAGALHAELIIQ
jgi:flagellar P-ring protein precursor FlgI